MTIPSSAMSRSLGHAAGSSSSMPAKKGSIADLVHPNHFGRIHPMPRSCPYPIQQVIHPQMHSSVAGQPQIAATIQGSGLEPRATYPIVSAGCIPNTQYFSPPRLMRPVPTKYPANYASFTTLFLTSVEIKAHWDDPPIVIDPAIISGSAPEDEFSEAIRRVWVNKNFRDRVRRTSVIDHLGRNNHDYKYFATYSQLMDDKEAYIRIVMYHQSGLRVDPSDSSCGNWILVIPRHLNDVCFPSQLRFYALHATCDGQYPQEEHPEIVEAARRGMSIFDKISWEHIYYTVHC